MTELFKVTDANHQTRGGMRWGPGVTHTAPGGELCTAGVIHAYTDTLLAAAFYRVHVGFDDPVVLWRGDGDVCTGDATKVGCTSFTTIEIIPMPDVPLVARVRWAIKCAYTPNRGRWKEWADRWLSGEDRTAAAADAAKQYSRMRSKVRAAGAAAAWLNSFAAHDWHPPIVKVALHSVLGRLDERGQFDILALLREAIAEEEAMP